jgi:hypothetical protein
MAKSKRKKSKAKKVPHSYVCGTCGSHLTPIAGVRLLEGGGKFVKLNALTADVLDTPTRTLVINTTVKNAATWAVNLDGSQLPITSGQPYSLPTSLGNHKLIAYVWGDVGASISAKGSVGGSEVVDCEATVLANGQPGADPESFTVT